MIVSLLTRGPDFGPVAMGKFSHFGGVCDEIRVKVGPKGMKPLSSGGEADFDVVDASFGGAIVFVFHLTFLKKGAS
jgi:hypothetical protein